MQRGRDRDGARLERADRCERPSGATRRLKLKLTRAGAALLRRHTTTTVTVTITTTGPQRPKTVAIRRLQVHYVPAGSRRRR